MSIPAGARDEILEQARRVASEAARRASIEFRDLHELDELRPVVDLFDRTWASDSGSYMPLNLLRALAHAGCHVSGAFDGPRLVGALVAFLGFHEEQLALHSHMLAVAPETRGRNIGYGLKLHQRAWSLGRGVRLITWTFDPLMSRNAYLNLTQLGASVAAYLPNFYGAMGDSINASDESDRILAAWPLDAERVIAATERAAGDDGPAEAVDGAVSALTVGPGETPVETAIAGDVVLCQIPRDIESIRRRDGALALHWRRALRHTLLAALEQGYEVQRFLPEGCYVLRRPG